ncbi:MAG: selenocysteine-specific translation elongation factor [Vulcanimicrobiaceae bacterium]
MHIVGTAGHVDHGKSSLVAALTGTNPDRWLEERLRGMTLDLGFAHLRFDDGTEAGIVDVPGHERFLHNMLAGAAGMELLLLVIAADEGVMPQTLEHLQILRFLNVRSTIVVVTKADLLDPDELAFAQEAIAESLRGTLAEGAPAIAVSATAGTGLDELRARMHAALLALPSRNTDAPAYMPVDRVFALAGHGTIVTGTLMQGTLGIGDTLKLEPSGKSVRVRSLQTFGQRIERASAGARVAVNLPNVDVGEIARGEMLAAPQFSAAKNFAVSFEALPDALSILRRRNPVRAYIGSAEILGTLVFADVPKGVAQVQAELFLRTPTIAHPGTAFVVRRMSPKTLLGGGRVDVSVQIAPGESHDEVHTPQEEAILAVLRASGLQALESDAIARTANLLDDTVKTALEALVERGEVCRVQRPTGYVENVSARAFFERAYAYIETQLRAEPWALGVTSVALSRALQTEEPLLVRLLAAFAEDGKLANRAGYYATPDHTPKLTQAQRTFFDSEVPADSAQPFVPADFAGVVAHVKQSRIEGIQKAFDTMLARGGLVKIGDSLYRGQQIAQIHARVEAFLKAERQMTMAQFRDVIGTSRKFAVPLLEWFDARGITVRSGDYRMLRSRHERS